MMDEILKALYSSNIQISGTQFRIILNILDNQDFNPQKCVEINVSYLAKDIKSAYPQTYNALKKLIGLNIVKMSENYSFKYRTGKMLKFNSPSEWIGG